MVWGKVPKEVWAELTDTPQEAEEVAYRSWASRREAKIMAKYGFDH